MEDVVKIQKSPKQYASVEAGQAEGLKTDGVAWDPTVTKKFVRLKKPALGYSADRIVGFDSLQPGQMTQMNQLIANGTAEPWPQGN